MRNSLFFYIYLGPLSQESPSNRDALRESVHPVGLQVGVSQSPLQVPHLSAPH